MTGRVSSRRIGLVTALLLVGAATFASATTAGATGAPAPQRPQAVTGSWPTVQLRLPASANTAGARAAVTVAIVDTGVTAVSGLRGAVLPGTDLVNGDADARDDNGHGTMLAGLAAGRASYGVCHSCSILPVKVLDAEKSGRGSVVAAGIRWAVAQGARVVNVSLNASSERPELTAALNAAIAQGVTVVIAAGNGGSADPSHEGYPGPSVPGAIRVAANTKEGRVAAWSNRGSWVDISAPGWASNIPRAGGGTVSSSGTSLSAAYVSGIAGLLLANNPALTPAQVKTAILAGGTPQPGLPVASSRIANAAGALAAANAPAVP